MKNRIFSIAVSTSSDRDVLIEPGVLRDHPGGFNVFQVNPSVLEARVDYDVPTFIRRGIRLSVAGRRSSILQPCVRLASSAPGQ